MLIISSYTANLAASLTQQRLVVDIQGYEDIGTAKMPAEQIMLQTVNGSLSDFWEAAIETRQGYGTCPNCGCINCDTKIYDGGTLGEAIAALRNGSYTDMDGDRPHRKICHRRR